jgi:hypothetical protein
MSTVKKASHWVPILNALAFAAGCGSVARPVAASGGNPASPSTDQKPAGKPPSGPAPTEQSFGDIHSRWQLQVRAVEFGLVRRRSDGVDAVATSPGAFKNIGSLVLTASQLSDYDGGGSADGLDQVESDGQYAAILAEPWIYVYKL